MAASDLWIMGTLVVTDDYNGSSKENRNISDYNEESSVYDDSDDGMESDNHQESNRE